MKYALTIIVIIILLIFPQKAYCSDSIQISHMEYDADGSHSWKAEYIEINDDSYLFERVEIALYYLINRHSGGNSYPYGENIDILSLSYSYGCITVDLSEEFNGYGGGSFLEQVYLAQIAKTLLDMEGIEKVTLLVDGLLANTAEGIAVKEVISWQELMDGKIVSTE